MAPTKFGLFKSRSKDQSDQPSVENLLQSSGSSDTVSPLEPGPSTSYDTPEHRIQVEAATHSLGDLTIETHPTPTRRASETAKQESGQMVYKQLKNQPSGEMTSTSTLQDEDFDLIQEYKDEESTRPMGEGLICDDATSCDANSIQFDETSIAPSEDMSVYCGKMRKPKKSKSKEEEQIIKDSDMWHASNLEVMQNLLHKSGTLDDQIKWQAIATSRGLCTLTDSCTCSDCHHAKILAEVTDGDAGLGAVAPLFNISVGCILQ